MVLIAGLIGIGLVIEVAERRHANKSAAKKNNSQEEQGSHDSRDAPGTTQAQLDERAFQEVQNYADFQKILSERVYDDLRKEEETPTSIYAPATTNTFKQRQTFSQPLTLDPSLFASASPRGLPFPVVIPQSRSEEGRMLWIRAYSPVLWQCGISQETFFHFVDSYNETIRNSPRFEVINILAMGTGFYSNISQALSSQAVPMAVGLAKGSQSLEPTSSFLRQANNQLFTPHGLYAMVVAFSHGESQVYTVDNSQQYQGSSTLNSESPLIPPTPLGFTEDKSFQASPKRARGSKSETKKGVRRPGSRRKVGQKADGLLRNAFEGAFPSRVRRPSSASSTTKGTTNGLREDSSLTQPFESGDMAQDVLYLLIVNDTSDIVGFVPASPGIQPPFHNHNANSRPYLQVDTSNRPWVYTLNNKGYESGDFDTSGNTVAHYNNDPPPAYDYMTTASYDGTHADEGDYCVPTL